MALSRALSRFSISNRAVTKSAFSRMPQLTLFADPNSKSLALSPSKSPKRTATTSASSSSYRHHQNGSGSGQPNLWALHHEQEDMAARNKSRAAAKAEGKSLEMFDEEGGDSGEKETVKKDHSGAHVKENDEGQQGEKRAKGAPGKKRERSPEGGGVAGSRDVKRHKNAYEIKGKVATVEDAMRADEDTPLDQLMRVMKNNKGKVEKGESVVYWMRMEDVRIEDNTAFAMAGAKAKELGLPLIVLYVLSPGDYNWHDRGPKKIDFLLRNLRYLKPKLDELNIPLHVVSYDKRLSIPRRLLTELLPNVLKTTHVFANIEYEVDELRRDIACVKLGQQKGIEVTCVHDRLAIPPGIVLSKQGKPMSVYSPWQRAWALVLEKEPKYLKMSEIPEANDKSIREHSDFGKLFDATPVPEFVEGFKVEEGEKLQELWPEGTDNAKELLDRFLNTRARKQQLELVSPLREDGLERDVKHSRINEYTTGRNLVNGDTSSRLSPYLALGVISARMVLNAAKQMTKGKLQSGRDTGVGMWVQEVAWRDFYNTVVATWPRVSMGRPFLEKFADVQWEVNEEHLQAWKDGKTGYPIVDAAMRAGKARGWMENRVRMVTASFLVKSLMLDWRLGEKHFMEIFIDGDLCANSGGWQWVSSVGTDPQPYFRIFNTITQSEKCDPNGDYIRYWVPELKNLKGKAIHDPFHNMPSSEFKKLGYPAPIVDHKQSRERALFRYKNVGEKEDGS